MKKIDQLLTARLANHMRILLKTDKISRSCRGVTWTQHYLIDLLARRGSMSMGGIAEHLGLEASTITRVVDVLARDGVVIRDRPENDRRTVTVALTAKGDKLAAYLAEGTSSFHEAVLARIPDPEKENIVRILKILDAAIEPWRAPEKTEE
jgi:DNA-binding MarR family transcriptional regulator